ncbi:hemolysin III family protein [Phenylobacterium montanum]|uniref:Hemolysin III family protein n=2 Tax=Phenylobacterium montanum TaxID=2823693 RepID=A0A975G512_9CAUL|nr:hemolysin III family protein [Caulobacter sp. S6]
MHAVGIVGAAAGGAFLVGLALRTGHGGGLTAATSLYALCLITMLGCSAAYNLSRPSAARPFLRRLDEAGIFMMIAGSYTPFTSQRFEGGWALGVTALVWGVALAGVAGKLLVKKSPDWLWTAVYVGFGWLAVFMIRPLFVDVPTGAFVLLVLGGLIYTTGTLVFHSRLPFRRAIWHGFVIAAASLHYVAVFTGVVLAAHA